LGSWGDLGLGTGATALALPASGLPTEGARLDGAHTGAGPAHGHAADLGAHPSAGVQVGAVALLLVGEGVGVLASPPRDARGARRLAVSPVCTRRKTAWQVVSKRASTSCSTWLGRAAYAGNAARRSVSSASCWKRVARGPCPRRPAPPGDPLLPGGGGAHAAAPEHLLQRPLLRGRRLEVLLVGFACGLRVWSAGEELAAPGVGMLSARLTPGTGEDFWLKPPHASPLPVKRRGVQRAKALSCHPPSYRSAVVCPHSLVLAPQWPGGCRVGTRRCIPLSKEAARRPLGSAMGMKRRARLGATIGTARSITHCLFTTGAVPL